MGIVQKVMPRSRLSLVTDNYDEEEEEKQLKIKQEYEPVALSDALNKNSSLSMTAEEFKRQDGQQVLDVHQLFPGFEKDKILNFSDLFMTRIQRPPKLQTNKRG